MAAVRKEDMLNGFKAAGIQKGDVLFVHASLRAFGKVEGGAKTAAEALVEAVGQEGTVVVPAFTFSRGSGKDPVIDPRNDPSEVGAVTEAVRTMPQAKRSLAYRHSVAAVGRKAGEITEANPEVSVFDMEGAFGKMLNLDAKIVLLGVPYTVSTSHHFAEYLLQVPYRFTVPKQVRVRQADGTVTEHRMTDYRPKPRKDGSYYPKPVDFNKLGKLLEERESVNIVTLGNAIVRVFRMKDLIELAKREYRTCSDMLFMAVDASSVTDIRVVVDEERMYRR